MQTQTHKNKRAHADIFNTVMAPGHVPLQTRAYSAATDAIAKGSSDLRKELKNVQKGFSS